MNVKDEIKSEYPSSLFLSIYENRLPIGSLLASASESDSKSNELKMSIQSHEPCSLIHHSFLSGFKCFYDDALTDLVNHYANRTLIVTCTKDYT